MYAAIYLASVQLQAVLRAEVPRPVLLLDATATEDAPTREQGRVLQVNDACRSCQVYPGMTVSMAQARCAAVELRYRDAEAEALAQRQLLACAETRSPYYEATAPGLCVLDLASLQDIRNHEQAWGKGICRELAQAGLTAQVGLAANPEMAALAAHLARPVQVIQGDEQGEGRRHLDALPVSVLHLDWQTAEVLALWGVKTVGQLRALPRSGVARRLGKTGLWLWDLASGRMERLLKLVRPDPGYRVEEELEHGLESLEPLLFLLRRHLQALCEALAAAWKVARAVRLELRFEDHTAHRRELRIAEPTREVELLFRVAHTALEHFTAAAPVCGLMLELLPVDPAGRQSLLFERTLRDPNRFAETLAHLEAVVGAGRVGRPRLLPSRRLDAFVVEGFFEQHDEGASSPLFMPAWEMTGMGLPLRRLRPPPVTQVYLLHDRPAAFQNALYNQTVTACDGPWLVSGDWWDAGQSWQREVWVVTGERGDLFQLARQKGGEWLMEGILG